MTTLPVQESAKVVGQQTSSLTGGGGPDALSAGATTTTAAEVPKKPILPSRTPDAVLSRLSPADAQRLHTLSLRLTGGASGASGSASNPLTAAEMKEFDALTGGNGFFSTGVGSWVNPWAYGSGNQMLYANIYARYGNLRAQVQSLLNQLRAPDVQTVQTPMLANELIMFLNEIGKEVAALQLNQSRLGQTAGTPIDVQRLTAFEGQFAALAAKFKLFVDQARQFKVQQTLYPQQAVQTLLAQQPYGYQPPFGYQPQPQFGPTFPPPPQQQYSPQPFAQPFIQQQQPQQQQQQFFQQLQAQQMQAQQMQAQQMQARQLQEQLDASYALQLQQQLQQQEQQARLQQQLQQQQYQQPFLPAPSTPSPFGNFVEASSAQPVPFVQSTPQFSSVGSQVIFNEPDPRIDFFSATRGQMFA